MPDMMPHDSYFRVFTFFLILLIVRGGTVLAEENSSVDQEDFVMLQPWDGPHGGVPPWDLVRPDEFVDTFDQAIALAQEEIEAIANNPEPPTFENTIVALEDVGRPLDRLGSLFGVHAGNLNVGPMPDIQKVVLPKMAAFRDSVTQNERLFGRVAAVYEGDTSERLSTAQRRLLEDRYKSFVRQGAKLNSEEKAHLSQINQRLARLFADFSQNVLSDEQNYVTWIEDQADLAGLPDSVIAAMANTAKDRGRDGKWAVANTRSAMEPFLTYADNRPLREQVWRTYYNRGDNGDQFDNNAIIAEILKLRGACQLARIRDPCSLAVGKSHGEAPRQRHGADDEDLAQSRCPCA